MCSHDQKCNVNSFAIVYILSLHLIEPQILIQIRSDLTACSLILRVECLQAFCLFLVFKLQLAKSILVERVVGQRSADLTGEGAVAR